MFFESNFSAALVCSSSTYHEQKQKQNKTKQKNIFQFCMQHNTSKNNQMQETLKIRSTFVLQVISLFFF